MNFTFPPNKAIDHGLLQDFSIADNGYITYEDIDILQPLQNQIQIDNRDYFVTYLSDATARNKGGNSIILKLFLSENIDLDDLEYGAPDKILKILKFKKARKPEWKTKSEKRFETEIRALKGCLEHKFQNVIKLFEDGVCRIYNPKNKRYDEYLYYTMEPAEYDLKGYIEANHHKMTPDQKISLCLSLADGLRELRLLRYYHRDIKPDNIFIVGDDWKIGDLGLLEEQNNATTIDEIAEPIGPRGWMTPESMNKYMTEGKGFKISFDCKIDHQSDIFQLGKVFWYIFQHNVPIGCIKESDFKMKASNKIYPILRTMLNNSKAKRFKEIGEVSRLLKPIETEVLKTAV